MQREHCTDPAIDYGTEVKVIVGHEAVYACVTESKPPASADYKLPRGKSVASGLRQLIAEADFEMAALAARTDRMRRALTMVERGDFK